MHLLFLSGRLQDQHPVAALALCRRNKRVLSFRREDRKYLFRSRARIEPGCADVRCIEQIQSCCERQAHRAVAVYVAVTRRGYHMRHAGKLLRNDIIYRMQGEIIPAQAQLLQISDAFRARMRQRIIPGINEVAARFFGTAPDGMIAVKPCRARSRK